VIRQIAECVSSMVKPHFTRPVVAFSLFYLSVTLSNMNRGRRVVSTQQCNLLVQMVQAWTTSNIVGLTKPRPMVITLGSVQSHRLQHSMHQCIFPTRVAQWHGQTSLLVSNSVKFLSSTTNSEPSTIVDICRTKIQAALQTDQVLVKGMEYILSFL
jgi:hypothetical protein